MERAPDGVQMFQAAAVFRRGAKSSIIVESANGLVLNRDTDKASRVRDHYSSLLCTLPQTVTCAGDLFLPLLHVEEITTSEITVALSRMTNQKSAGPDILDADLLKYGAEYLSPLIANIINTAIETNRDASQVIGVGTLVPLAKPGKPRGPVTSLRPIILQNTIRKALSLVLLKRITPSVETHLGPAQASGEDVVPQMRSGRNGG